eukprot:gene16656-19793_t
MISSVQWIPKGAANPFPKKYDHTEDEEALAQELEDAEAQAELEDLEDEEEDNVEEKGEDAEDKTTEDQEETAEDDDFNKRYKMDEYDDDDEEENKDPEELGLKFINKALKGLMFYKNPDDDPHLNEQEEDIEDLEDFIIRPTDSLLITAVANEDDEFSHIDVMVYEEDCNNLYVHHDIILGSFPICLAWMDQNPITPTEKGSFVAVGTFEPAIEIWDLDVVDNAVPTAILGQNEVDKGLRKKRSMMTTHSHSDAVMALSWNPLQRNVLASGSSDKTAKIWDITTQNCISTFTHHKDKIQSLHWNPQEKTVLLCGSYDKSISIIDVRIKESSSYFKWPIPSDCEVVQWNPHNPKQFVVGTDDGMLTCFDATLGSNSKPLWQIQAHNKSLASFSYCPGQADYFATGSADHTVKLWKNGADGPQMLEKKNVGEEVFSVSFFASSPYLLAIGSETNRPTVVNTRRFKSVQGAFGVDAPAGFKREPSLEAPKKKKAEDDDDEDDDMDDSEDYSEDDDESDEDDSQDE